MFDLIRKLFHPIKTLEQKTRQEMEALREQASEGLLEELNNCNRIDDLLSLHRKMDAMCIGFYVSVKLQDQRNGYSNVSIHDATVEHYWCSSFDRDSTYHGWEMLEYEKNPTKDEYNYFSYAKAWQIYWSAIYMSLTHRMPTDIKYPQWLLDQRPV